MNETLGRLYLEEAVGQAKARNARRSAENLRQGASEVRDSAAELIARHPFTAVAGGVAAGMLIGALLPRRACAKGTSALGALIGQAALDYGRQTLKMVKEARHARGPVIVEAEETGLD